MAHRRTSHNLASTLSATTGAGAIPEIPAPGRFNWYLCGTCGHVCPQHTYCSAGGCYAP